MLEFVRDEFGIPAIERSIDRTELSLADEVFLAGTGVQIVSVTRIDHRPVGSGRMGPVTDRLRKLNAAVVHGEVPRYRSWCWPVYANAVPGITAPAAARVRRERRDGIRRPGPAFLEYYERVRGRTSRVVDRIPAERLDWTWREGKFTLGDLVRHIAAIERYMYAENVKGKPSRYPGHGRELADGLPAVRAFFDRTHAESVAIFAKLTDADLAGKSVTPAGAAITTSKWLRADGRARDPPPRPDLSLPLDARHPDAADLRADLRAGSKRARSVTLERTRVLGAPAQVAVRVGRRVSRRRSRASRSNAKSRVADGPPPAVGAPHKPR